jgi:hypothetical protein
MVVIAVKTQDKGWVEDSAIRFRAIGESVLLQIGVPPTSPGDRVTSLKNEGFIAE